MSYNNSTVGTVPESWRKLPQYFIYFGQGLVMAVGNFILALCIFYHRAMRCQRQYFVISFMFLADAVNGSAQLFASVYRTALLFLDVHDVKISRWECMTKVHSLFWTFSEPCAALMLAVISFDRLILVVDPGYYLSNNYTLTYISIITPYLWSFLSLLLAVTLAYVSSREATVEQYCLLSFGHGDNYWAYHGILSVFGSGLSILLFMFVLIIRKKRQQRVAASSDTSTHVRQRKITKSIGISCIFTLIFFLIPRAIGTGIHYISTMDKRVIASLMMILYWIIGNINPILNLFIFAIRHREVRKGVKAMFMGKTLPPDLRLWFDGRRNARN